MDVYNVIFVNDYMFMQDYVKKYEEIKYNVKVLKLKNLKESDICSDYVESYCNVLFKLILLYKNLDSVVDMVDGNRSVCFVKYELFVYNLINKIKYVIGFIYLIVLIEGIFLNE